MCLVQLRVDKKRKKKEKRKKRKRECWENRKSGKEKGNRKIKKEKQKNLLCGLNVGEIEIDLGVFMTFNDIY